MIDPNLKFLFRAANEAGFPIAKITGDEITWADAEPSKAALKSIQLEAKRAEVGQTILAQMASMGRALVAKYPVTEQQGWPQKLTEAQAIADGSLDPKDAFQLGIEAGITGENVADLATATLAAAQLTGMIPAITAGLRRKLEAGIATIKSEAELDALQATSDQVRIAIMGAFSSGDPATIKDALSVLSS